MQRGLLTLTILLFGMTTQAHAQDFGRATTRIALPGVTFDLALNGAEQYVERAGDRLTLKSPAKRDNFRDPDGKLSNDSAPMLLAEVDNTKPFTFTAKVTPAFSNTYDAGALYIWAGLHYLLAARRLRRDMAAVQQA